MNGKAVGHNAQMRPWPVPACQQYEIRQLRVNRGLTAQKRKNLGCQATRPGRHPTFRLVQREKPLVALVRIMRAALTCEAAAMGTCSSRFRKTRTTTPLGFG